MTLSPCQLHTESPITSEWHCLQSNLASWERETLIWRSERLGVGRTDFFFFPQKPLAEYKISHSPLILGTEIKFTWQLILLKNTALCRGAMSSGLTDDTVLVSFHGGGDAPSRKRSGAKKDDFTPSFIQQLCLQYWEKASWYISRKQIISSLGILF